MTGITYPTPLDELPAWERRNPGWGLCVVTPVTKENLLSAEYDEQDEDDEGPGVTTEVVDDDDDGKAPTRYVVLHRPPRDTPLEKTVWLMLIGERNDPTADGPQDRNHYVWLAHTTRAFQSTRVCHQKVMMCRSCGTSRVESAHASHEAHCFGHKSADIKMPSGERAKKRFRLGTKAEPNPRYITADTETLHGDDGKHYVKMITLATYQLDGTLEGEPVSLELPRDADEHLERRHRLHPLAAQRLER
eukprot:jgi/Chrzof1/5846/Cz16g17290.t1